MSCCCRKSARCFLWLGLFVSTGLLAGCSGRGILLTPVTTSRELEESVLLRESRWTSDKIALIDISGVIMNSKKFSLLSEGEQPVSLLLEQLDKAARDSRVKAVILRINSPGGSVTASELMHDEIEHFRKSTGKPVIAVMMDVAASGGYYIACACDEIVAHRSTVTGSIGVIVQLFDLSSTLSKLGVRSEAFTTGPYKDSGSPFRTMRDDERALWQHLVDDMYERFISVVDKGRPNLTEAQVRKLADGRVYTALQALDAGLIDRISNMRKTIARLKQQIGADKIKLVSYKRPLDYRPNYYAASPAPQPQQINIFHVELPSSLSSGPRFLYLWSPSLH